jgi:hypothetical protein
VDVALHVVEQVEAAPAHRTRVRLHASVVHLPNQHKGILNNKWVLGFGQCF